MSFTMWYTKPDGRKIPIRMSIWDAMKGVPDPKPRKPKPCSCCGKAHAKDMCKEDGKGEEKKDDHDRDKNKSGHENTKGKDKNVDSDLTEDDRIILRMKGENPEAQWKDILAQTKHFNHVGELKSRWKHISHRLEAGNRNHIDEDKKDKDVERKERIKRYREEGLKRKAEREAAQARKEEEEKKKVEEQTDDSTKSDEKHNNNKPTTPNGNAQKPGSSPHSLKEWADTYDKKKWQIMASKHYDKTGERITPAQARKLAEAP
ncbi:hypothetical protein AYL99_05983 [Fonsecaea erecta]|uniref:Myb-like domain-containing protein n=1 Tax=Fonsecaea erecta TaxID=1367422 RepID=A0A178ZMD2_9EURO|nr:hypothetical protein AYL99_05983 [Fonsecaea erecta]OAP60979.1 hypothetical protein AYL99_05983 [Fonsecaea erecta]